MANVLRMAACELGDPVLFQVLAKADDALLAHGNVLGWRVAGGDAGGNAMLRERSGWVTAVTTGEGPRAKTRRSQ